MAPGAGGTRQAGVRAPGQPEFSRTLIRASRDVRKPTICGRSQRAHWSLSSTITSSSASSPRRCSRLTESPSSARLRHGATALAQAKRLRPDVVLLDVQLPDLDGFEVAARLGAAPGSPHVVLVSNRELGGLRPPVRARSRVRLHLQGRALRPSRACRPRRLSRSQWLRLLLWPTGVAIWLLAEWRLFGWSAPRSWIPDLLTGLVAGPSRGPGGPRAAAGSCSWQRDSPGSSLIWERRRGPGLPPPGSTSTGARSFTPSRLDAPSGRTRDLLDHAAVATGWIVAVVAPVWRSQTWTIEIAQRLAGYADRALRGLSRGGAAVPESRGSGGDRPGRGDRGYCRDTPYGGHAYGTGSARFSHTRRHCASSRSRC